MRSPRMWILIAVFHLTGDGFTSRSMTKRWTVLHNLPSLFAQGNHHNSTSSLSKARVEFSSFLP